MNPNYFPNSWGRIGQTWHVAQRHPAASDTNDGTADAPLATISAAARQINEFDTILIDEGVYREEVELPRHGHPYRPEGRIIFQAVAGKEVYWRGSDIFEATWNETQSGIWSAPLPPSLFEPSAFNPYALGLACDVTETVRPSAALAETRGQIYLDGQPCVQARSFEQLQATPFSFLVDEEGRNISINFGTSRQPHDFLIELTMRQRCLRPLFGGAVFAETRGIVVEHAAEPGPFCKCPPQSLRLNSASGIAVYKSWNFPGSSTQHPTLINRAPSYRAVDDPTILASLIDDSQPRRHDDTDLVHASSNDAGRTWRLDEASRQPYASAHDYSYTLDERAGVLMRHTIDYRHGFDPHGFFGSVKHAVTLQLSFDGGKSWGESQLIHEGKRYYHNIVPLADGTLFWPFMEGTEGNRHHARIGTVVGRWSEDRQSIAWEQTGWIEVAPEESQAGLAEPSVAQFADGRLFMVLRMGAMLPAQDRSGQPSVKLFSVSEDSGRSWSQPQPLTYDDGQYIYSPRSFQQTFRSIKNDRVYVLMNIVGAPTLGCDPRTAAHLIEIDAQSLRARRDTLTIIDRKHPEHHDLIRYSNWQMIQDRAIGNPILFMRLNMSEFCPIRFGYDVNLYRYEVVLPNAD